MKKLIHLLIIVGLGYVGYHVAYQPPELKKMNELLVTQPTTNVFSNGFEKVEKLRDLFDEDFSIWHEIVLQHNTRAIRRTVRHCMLNKYYCDIDKSLGNYIELDDERKRSGKYSLKFHAEPFDPKFFGDSKAAIRRQLLNFKKGDEIYFSGWFFIEDDDPDTEEHHGLSLLAFRSQSGSLRYLGEPGRRISLEGKGLVYSDTDNWLPQPPIFKQDALDQLHFPEDKWVHVKIYMKLSEGNDGKMEVWQNDTKILSERGATLPERDTVYSIFEVGILNNQNQVFPQTVYVDDIWISPVKFPEE